MKNLIFLTLVIGATFLAGCNKGSMSQYRVKTITSSKGQTTTFAYDKDNKINLITASDSTKVTFTYNGSTITQLVSNPMNPVPRTQTFHLTSAGYMDSSTSAGPMGQILTLNTQDAEGHNTVTKEYYGGQLKRTTTATFKDGNEVQRAVSSETGELVGTIYFEYFMDKPNSFSNESRGMKFMGQDEKNLMKRIVQVLAKGDTVGTATFSYKFDDKGRITSKATYDKGVQADSINLSYY